MIGLGSRNAEALALASFAVALLAPAAAQSATPTATQLAADTPAAAIKALKALPDAKAAALPGQLSPSAVLKIASFDPVDTARWLAVLA